MNSKRAPTLIEAFIGHEHMQSSQRYAAEGRRYAALEVGRLEALWLDGWRRCFLDPALPPLSRDFEDLSAELLLRGRDYPKHLISASEWRWMAALWGPVYYAPEVQKELQGVLQDFAAASRQPKH